MRYKPNRGGHAPGHLRDAFAEAVETERAVELDGIMRSPHWLAGQLWNCTDVMPSALCKDLDLPRGSTYARGARQARTSW